MTYERERAVLAEAVQAAGAAIREHFVAGAQVYTKADNSPVTDADLAASAILVERLRAAFPDDGILTEEAPPDDATATAPRCWIIDPLDGTAQFIRREPVFAVMVALEVGGRPIVGAIYDPMRDALFAAVAGGGATVARGGGIAPLRFAPVPFAVARIGTSPGSYTALTTDSPRWKGDPARLMRAEASFGFRPEALETRFDAYIGWLANRRASGGYPWDLCATDLIIHEAGGVITDIHGAPYTYRRVHERLGGGIIAATDATLHAEVRRHLDATGESAGRCGEAGSR